MNAPLPSLNNAKRLVVKVGSALVTDEVSGAAHQQWMASLADDIATLRKQGSQVILVSSGAVSLGRNRLKLAEKSKLKLEEKQAAAACGQVLLMEVWQKEFARHNIEIAQVLLTLDDSEHRPRYLNARLTLNALLELGVLPIINENDTVATAELRFGDNDRLAARVAQMAGADMLAILSDIDGFYDTDPTKNLNAKRFERIDAITPELEAMAGKSRSSVGSGGMITKVSAAKIATGAGCHTLIASGHEMHPLRMVASHHSGTWFVSAATPSSARKRWILGTLEPAGTLVVDHGAAMALRAGKSLLPAGVLKAEGEFARGEAVRILGETGEPIATGLIGYTAEETRKIIGKQSDDISSYLGYRGRSALVHCDDLALH